ncbi:MAG: UDP-N-acetylmuramoyl-tripeptide--D-alanyl-D-alanine ligase [Crocinitomicaceae bacterium]
MEKQLTSPFYSSKGICTDTRKIFNGCLFVCIQGENFDGNTFAKEALKQGAHHVIVDNPSYYQENTQMTLVENSIAYLQGLANHHRNTFNIPVIGITGSNGKTTTKELVHTVLKKKFQVLATEGNLNNHLGVPLTLLRMHASHEIAIIEMGANRFGDIEELSAIAEPTHGIITNIGKAHLEGFGGFDGVLKTKRELYESLESNRGTIIINGDDDVLTNIAPKLPCITYGEGKNNDLSGNLVGLSPFVEMTWSYKAYASESLQTKMIGKYNFYNYLAAATFGVHFGVPNSDISDALQEYTPTNNRSQVSKTERNTLILDCYNANPTSMKSALDSFNIMSKPNKIFIIGDMRELGNEAKLEHQRILELIETHGLKGYTVGEEFGKVNSDRILKHFNNVEEALDFFQKNQINDSLILLKGSRGVQLEKLTPAF